MTFQSAPPSLKFKMITSKRQHEVVFELNLEMKVVIKPGSSSHFSIELGSATGAAGLLTNPLKSKACSSLYLRRAVERYVGLLAGATAGKIKNTKNVWVMILTLSQK